MSSQPAKVVPEIEDLIQARLQKQNCQEQRGEELRKMNWVEQILHSVNLKKKVSDSGLSLLKASVVIMITWAKDSQVEATES